MTFGDSSISQHYTLDIEPEGRLTLPKEIQKILSLKSGDRLILTLEDNGKLQLGKRFNLPVLTADKLWSSLICRNYD
jgi:AbrB family looped-hinge helix DNA binding protein